MRRQFSNSAVTSTGSPARLYTQATSWSLVGPPRTLTRSALRLTKRGIGRPLTFFGEGGSARTDAIAAIVAATATTDLTHARCIVPTHASGRNVLSRQRLCSSEAARRGG